MLTTLTYTLDPKRLGKVALYSLSEDFALAWSHLPSYRDHDGARPVRPAYAALATALSAVTNQPVVIMPDTLGQPDAETAEPTMLATTKPIDRRLLHRAVRAWERHIRGGDDANTLAPLLGQCQEARRNLADFITDAATGRPLAPQWFFRVAAWNLAAALAKHRFHLPPPPPPRPKTCATSEPAELEEEPGAATPPATGEAPQPDTPPPPGPHLEWLMDTNGSLLAWNHVLTNTAGRRQTTGAAMHKLDFRVVTLPGESRIAVHILPTSSRLATHWASTRTAFVSRGKNTVLRLPVGHRRTEDGWQPYIRGYTAQVVDACELEGITLCSNAELAAIGGPVRALVPAPTDHPLGKGTGTRFNLALARHIHAALGTKYGLEQVTYTRTGYQVTRTTKGPVLREHLDQALAGTGHQHVRILALYDHEYTRDRMTAALAPYADTPDAIEHWQDEQDCPLTGRVSVRLRRLPALTATTRPDWDRELAFLDDLPPVGLSGVWVETLWNPKKKTTRRDHAADYDPKRDLRRHFHQRGMVSQFIAQKERPTPKGETIEDSPHTDSTDTALDAGLDQAEPAKASRARPRLDYPAINGLSDLLLRLGAIDRRMAHAVGLDHPAVLVGLHLRQQRSSTRTLGSADKTQMVEVLTAVHTHPDPDVPWRLEMYSRRHHAWLPVPDAEAAFGSGPIGIDGHARHQDGAQLVREEIRAALRILPGTTPAVIFVDAEACRTIWPGLQHARLGEGALPSDTLQEEGRIAATVCVNTSYSEVPTPVDRADGRRRDPHRPATPDEWLHQRTTTTGVTSWYLAQASRTYSGFGQTSVNGSQHTRFTIPEHQRTALLAKDWSSFTAIQITVPEPGPYPAEKLAALAAALCHQSLVWDSRTRHPAPLHVAGCVDRNHSEYRGATLTDQGPIDEKNADQP
ncbi:RNaseH domain-containing protein [Streptomyces sp. NPDC048416]|uniref:RNaseH domain-containing protein n=1 Tax=Streptomyces sp. NPDC048416 TaxID=3365546 RepID=UPI0037198251